MTPDQLDRLKRLLGHWQAAAFKSANTQQDIRDLTALLAEVERLEEKNARLTQMMQRIAEDVLPDPVAYDSLTPEGVRDGFIEAWNEARDENARLAKVVEEAEAQKEAWLKHHAGTNDDDKRLMLGVILRILAAARPAKVECMGGHDGLGCGPECRGSDGR